MLNAGTQTLHVDFTPTDTANYNTASKEVTINVLPAPLKIPTITWSNPADITVGTALSSTQLNAVAKDPVSGATVDGIFTYNPAAGNVLAVGNAQSLKVDFAPTDTANYNTASKEVTITVLKQPLPPVSSFRGNVTSGYAPLTVQFTDLSEDATEWSWDFGDKTYSTDQNPVHTYSKDKKYTVSLTVKNSLGTDTVEKDKYISISKLK